MAGLGRAVGRALVTKAVARRESRGGEGVNGQGISDRRTMKRKMKKSREGHSQRLSYRTSHRPP